MKLWLAAAGILLLVGTGVHADVYFDSDDGYVEGSEGVAPTNPCAPETYVASECVTPE